MVNIYHVSSRVGKKMPPSLSDRVLAETEEAVNSTFSFLNDHLVDEEDENLRYDWRQLCTT